MAIPRITYTPSSSYESALERAAELWGIQPEFWDIFGHRHVATSETLAAVLRSLGVYSETRESLDAAVENRLWSEWASPVNRTIVKSLSDGVIPVQLEAGENGLDAVIHWEGGELSSISLSGPGAEPIAEAEIRGKRFVRVLLPLPENASLGYHRIVVTTASGRKSEGRLILCPDRAWQPGFLENGGKGAGVAVSLYGLRSSRNWGCGDFTDLEQFTQWASESLGVAFVALNPLHAIPNRQPYNTSPYLPNCSFYRNGLYIDVERLDEFGQSRWAVALHRSPRVQSCLADLRATPDVEYEKVWRLKLIFLKLAFREWMRRNPAGTEARTEFDRFAAQEGTLLHRFAVYQALDESIHKKDRNVWIWPDWPQAYHDPDSPEVASFEQEHPRLILFFKYVQWRIDSQLSAAQRFAQGLGMPIGVYHDLALATDRCGSDLWAHRQAYVGGCRVGSPPDDFSPRGQDWAFPPPNSAWHRDSGYELFAQSIRKNSRHGGALRIDHVMRFFRLFWITDGQEATNGVYVHDYSDDLIRILALESVRGQFLVIGEDLGTVEPYIREALRRFGILSYRLLYFEKDRDGSFKTPDSYPIEALVSVSTHDLPTLAGFWLNRDIDARRAAGVISDEASFQEQLQGRETEKQRMLDVMFRLRLLPDWMPRQVGQIPQFTGELHNAAVGFLANTPSSLFVLNGEDLFKDTDQQNLPGTTEQYPNWRHKLRYTLEELRSDPEASGCALMFRTWLSKTGRLQPLDQS